MLGEMLIEFLLIEIYTNMLQFQKSTVDRLKLIRYKLSDYSYNVMIRCSMF